MASPAPDPSRGWDAGSEPDPARGLFETVLAADGRPVRLAAHLDRLAGSTAELFGQSLPPDLESSILAAARPLSLGRIRIDLLPTGEGAPADRDGGLPRYEIAAEPIDPATFFPPKENGADLQSVRHPGYVGGHKLVDRDWLERVEAELGDTVPLILTPADEVLEAGRANLFLVLDGTIATPPLDDRVLPGTARAATLALAADLDLPAIERRLQLADLRSADDLFLTSSLRGIRPVRTLDGEPLGPADPLVERLASALRRRWLDEG